MNLEKSVNKINDVIAKPLASLLKVALRSHRPTHCHNILRGRSVIVMGNGPSLRSFLDLGSEAREGFDLMAVNFAAITPDFFEIKPQLYILADPHFFNGAATDANVAKLWENLSKVDWPMTLWLPAERRKLSAPLRMNLPENVTVKWYNLTPVEGKSLLTRYLIDKGWGMPRPRNVLIPAIVTAVREGYDRIFIVGADHTWSRDLWVDDENRVISVQPHFYKDNEKEQQRVRSEYAGYHLHDILNSLTVAFRSYFDIAAYADSKGIKIYNATPGSFIDAFPRCDCAQMKQLCRK